MLKFKFELFILNFTKVFLFRKAIFIGIGKLLSLLKVFWEKLISKPELFTFLVMLRYGVPGVEYHLSKNLNLLYYFLLALVENSRK